MQLILPFTVGVYCLIAHQYALDPIMGLIGVSEYTFMEFYAIREPYVRRLLIKRSTGILVFTIAVGPCSLPALCFLVFGFVLRGPDSDPVVALVCIYTLVPGKRL